MKIDDSWYKKPKNIKLPIRLGAGGVIVKIENQQIFVGLVKGDGFGDYILPKGGQENRETLLETAKREIGVESGITDLRPLADLGFKERLTFEKDYWSKMKYFLFFTKQRTGVATDPYENYIIEWFDINKLPPMFWPEQKELIEENRLKIKQMVSSRGGGKRETLKIDKSTRAAISTKLK